MKIKENCHSYQKIRKNKQNKKKNAKSNSLYKLINTDVQIIQSFKQHKIDTTQKQF